MINLYDKNIEYETVTNNGLATLQPITCELKVAINGTWQLYMELPYDADGKYKLIQPDMLLRVTDINCINSDYYGEKQWFRIADCKKLDATMQVIAYPVGMDARFDTFVHKMDLTGKTASDAISTINGVSNKYTVTTNLTNQKAIGDRIYENQNIISILNGDDGFTDSWGGEIVYDNNSIKVRSNCGTSQTGDVRYGKNIASMTYDYDTSNVVTRIYPKSKNGDILNDISQYKIANTKYVDSPHFNEYPFARIYYMQAPYTLTQTKNDGSDTYTRTMHALIEAESFIRADISSMFKSYHQAGMFYNTNITFFKETYDKTTDKDGLKGLAERYWEALCNKTSTHFGHKLLSNEFKSLLKTAVNDAFKDYWTQSEIKYEWQSNVTGYYFYSTKEPFDDCSAFDYQSTWVKKGSAWWYLNSSGTHTPTSRVDKGTWKWYKVSPTGLGTFKRYGNKSNNRYLANQLVKLDGIWYWFDQNGKPTSGTSNIYAVLNNRFGSLFDVPSEDALYVCIDGESDLFTLLYTHMSTYISNIYSNTNIDEPVQTISVDMVDIQNALGYSNYKDLLRLHLGDTVNCINNKTGIASQSRIIELTYDVLRKYNSNVVIGTASSSVVDILRSIGGQSDNVQLVAGDGISIQNNVISVTNPQTGVQDVQVNGESVVDGKIAFIDLDYSGGLKYWTEEQTRFYNNVESYDEVTYHKNKNEVFGSTTNTYGSGYLFRRTDDSKSIVAYLTYTRGDLRKLAIVLSQEEAGTEVEWNLKDFWEQGLSDFVPMGTDISIRGRDYIDRGSVEYNGTTWYYSIFQLNYTVDAGITGLVNLETVDLGNMDYAEFSGYATRTLETLLTLSAQAYIGNYDSDYYLRFCKTYRETDLLFKDYYSVDHEGNVNSAGIDTSKRKVTERGDVDERIDSKQDKLTAGEGISLDENSLISVVGKQDTLNPMYGMVIDELNNIYLGTDTETEIGHRLRGWSILQDTGFTIRAENNTIIFDWGGYQNTSLIMYDSPLSNVPEIDYTIGITEGGSLEGGVIVCLSATKLTEYVSWEDLDKLAYVRLDSSSEMSGVIDCSDIDGEFYLYVYDYYTDATIYSLNIHNVTPALDTKQDKLTAGTNITIDENNVISATGGGGSSAMEITKAEYDALPEAQKKNGTIYFVPDY